MLTTMTVACLTAHLPLMLQSDLALDLTAGEFDSSYSSNIYAT